MTILFVQIIANILIQILRHGPGVGGVAVLLAVPYLLVDVLLGLLLLAAAAGLHGGAHADQEGRGDAVAATTIVTINWDFLQTVPHGFFKFIERPSTNYYSFSL